MIKWLRNYFDILPRYVGEQIMISNEYMAWNFIDNKSSKMYRRFMVTEVKIYDTQ